MTDTLSMNSELNACVLEKDLTALRRRLRAIPDKTAKGSALAYLIAIQTPIQKVEIFLEAGADVNVKVKTESGDTTPLISACFAGVEYVKQLLRYGATVDVRKSTGDTPLSHACALGHLAIIKLLLEHGADIKAVNNKGHCVLVKALTSERGNSSETLPFLISKGATVDHVSNSGFTPLLYAAQSGIFDAMKALLEAGANVNYACDTNNGGTCLHSVSQYAQKDAANALRIVKLLLKHGANVNAVTHNGCTPLLGFARYDSCLPIVQLLLQHGAKVDAVWQPVPGNKFTPLLMGCRVDIRIVELLLQAGADPNEWVGESRLLEQVTRMEEPKECVIRMLLKAGADANLHVRTATNPYPALVNAVIHQDRSTVKCLLQYGAHKPQGVEEKKRFLDFIVRENTKDMAPLFAYDGCGLDLVEEKPARLTEEELLLKFIFTFCAHCREDKKHEDLMICGGCRIVAYCNAECQRAHWKEHKKICKQKQVNDEMARTTDNCV